MGNCSPIGISGEPNSSNSIRILTDSGSILEFKYPKLVQEVIKSFPGHEIFQQGHGESALGHDKKLLAGKFYYLLPLPKRDKLEAEYVAAKTGKELVNNLVKEGPALEVLPSDGDGFWRVKLMIDSKRLEEIFSEQDNIETLIERMRTVVNRSGCVTPRHVKSGWKPSLSSLLSKNICESNTVNVSRG